MATQGCKKSEKIAQGFTITEKVLMNVGVLATVIIGTYGIYLESIPWAIAYRGLRLVFDAGADRVWLIVHIALTFMKNTLIVFSRRGERFIESCINIDRASSPDGLSSLFSFFARATAISSILACSKNYSL